MTDQLERNAYMLKRLTHQADMFDWLELSEAEVAWSPGGICHLERVDDHGDSQVETGRTLRQCVEQAMEKEEFTACMAVVTERNGSD